MKYQGKPPGRDNSQTAYGAATITWHVHNTWGLLMDRVESGAVVLHESSISNTTVDLLTSFIALYFSCLTLLIIPSASTHQSTWPNELFFPGTHPFYAHNCWELWEKALGPGSSHLIYADTIRWEWKPSGDFHRVQYIIGYVYQSNAKALGQSRNRADRISSFVTLSSQPLVFSETCFSPHLHQTLNTANRKSHKL